MFQPSQRTCGRGEFRRLAHGFCNHFAATLCLLAAGLCAAPAPAPPALPGSDPRFTPLSQRTLRVDAATDAYPYSYIDESGKLTGFAVDLLDALAAASHLHLEREPTLALEGARRFAAGEFDLGQFAARPPGHDADPEYSLPVLVLQGALFVREHDSRFETMADLRARRAVVATPPQGQLFALAEGLDPGLVRMRSAPDALQELAAGRVDAVLLARLTGLAQIQHLGLRGLTTAGPPLEGFTITYTFVVHKDEGRLMNRLNEGLGGLYRTGEYARIHAKWFAHVDRPAGFSHEQVAALAALALALGLAGSLWALQHQRRLQHRLALQARELAESQRILDEAQRFARIGHAQRGCQPGARSIWSNETYRVYERDPRAGVPTVEELIQLAIPADRPPWKAAMEGLLQEGRTYEIDVTIEPRPGLRKVINARGRAIRDAAGQITGTFGTVQDVTAARAADAALRRSEKLLRALYDNIPLALGVVERTADDWTVIVLNPEALRQWGLPAPAATFRDLGLPPDQHRFWTRLFAECVATQKPVKREIARNELRRAYDVTVVPLGTAGDNPRCCFLAADITERKLRDAEVAQGRRLRAVGELVGGIAHEFNNLLTPILASADLLRQEWAHLPGVRTETGMIAEAAQQAAALTRRLLAFGRKSERQMERLDLRVVVAANLDLVAHTIDRRIRLDNAVPPDLPPVFLQDGDLHQILLNLLVNAHHTLDEKLATRPPADWTPLIRVEACALPPAAATPVDPARSAPAGGWVQLTVRDNGMGIPDTARDRIFEPFFTTKDVGQGTGLGLATVWHLVAEFGGRVTVESTPGEGSAFHILLPVHPPAVAAAAPTPPPPVPAAPPARSRRILIAEDEATVARVVTTVLQRQQHTVAAAANGLEAWEKLSAEPGGYDLVIMDLNMPGLSGIELAQRARMLPDCPPLILMSGRVTEAERAQLAALQVHAVVNKPFTLDAFLAAVNSALHRPGASGGPT